MLLIKYLRNKMPQSLPPQNLTHKSSFFVKIVPLIVSRTDIKD